MKKNYSKILKEKAVIYKGSGCIVCGYDRCNAALEFHHLNPDEKDFSISNSGSWRKVKNELDKCVLVCSNCHREIHQGEIEIESSLINNPSSSEGDELLMYYGYDPYY